MNSRTTSPLATPLPSASSFPVPRISGNHSFIIPHTAADMYSTVNTSQITLPLSPLPPYLTAYRHLTRRSHVVVGPGNASTSGRQAAVDVRVTIHIFGSAPWNVMMEKVRRVSKCACGLWVFTLIAVARMDRTIRESDSAFRCIVRCSVWRLEGFLFIDQSRIIIERPPWCTAVHCQSVRYPRHRPSGLSAETYQRCHEHNPHLPRRIPYLPIKSSDGQ